MAQDNDRPTLSSVYDPKQVEDKWYRYWEDHGLFRADPQSNKPPFTMVIPPPNVTGSLHMGHGLNNSIQDVLIRWHRMNGHEALWVPGTDHAGIATQHVVEKMLRTEGLTRHDIGREAFIERVWEWKEKYGDTIINQLKRLGASCDWSRLRFTMDDGCSAAVREVFVSLYNKGLIYQDDYITNWCPVCGTALSDLEVEHDDSPSRLYHISYPLETGDGEITVATTRPETMLGDTAVAVHPEDPRYRDLIGQYAILPIIGRRLLIVGDEYADPEFGTGAVKVTPAHDANDFDIGRRHGLEVVTVIGRDGRMTDAAGPYAGTDRLECRDKVIERLREEGRLVEVTEHRYALGHCYRCDSVVEPLISRQWFVRMRQLAEPAIKAVADGTIEFVPDRFARTYTQWLDNIRDWCISRQIWWGHRIPVWYCSDCGERTVAVTDPTACAHCSGQNLTQDEDVLDTWFSSALWPFSTLGWPERTRELEFFFPTSVLVTAYDIIFFWVARMIFMSLEFMGQQPFSQVIIHGVVRAEDGQRMSKSRGTGIDPLEAIDRYGADALRFSLLTAASPGMDQRFRWERIDNSRNFCNKLWNAARFTLMNLNGQTGQVSGQSTSKLALADRWILSRLELTRSRVTELLEGREFGEAAQTLYGFLWDELCDWYLELIKPRLYERLDPLTADEARQVLWTVMERSVRLLHPFMPFITEEIWQALGAQGQSVMTADWPEPRPEWIDQDAERDIELIMEATRAIRNLRAEVKVPPGKRAAAHIHSEADRRSMLEAQAGYIAALTGSDPLVIEGTDAARPAKALTDVIAGAEVFLPLAGLIDLGRERTRLERELESARSDHAACERRLADERFVSRAPAQVVDEQRTRRAVAEERIARLERRIRELGD